MPRIVEVSSADFPSFKNLEAGTPIDIIGQGNIVDVRNDGGNEIVMIELRALEGKTGLIGRFDKMEKILNKIVGKDGRIQVTTQQSHLGNT